MTQEYKCVALLSTGGLKSATLQYYMRQRCSTNLGHLMLARLHLETRHHLLKLTRNYVSRFFFNKNIQGMVVTMLRPVQYMLPEHQLKIEIKSMSSSYKSNVIPSAYTGYNSAAHRPQTPSSPFPRSLIC